MDPHHETWELWIKKDKPPEEFFEVAAGTILVQNTNWVNVNKAIMNLSQNGINSFASLVSLEPDLLEDLIRPAGFFKQKSRYLVELGECPLRCTKEQMKWLERWTINNPLINGDIFYKGKDLSSYQW